MTVVAIDGIGGHLGQEIEIRGWVYNLRSSGSIHFVLLRDGRKFATLRTRRFDLLPHSSGIAEFAYGGAVRGPVIARVVLRPAAIGRSRSFRVTVP